MANYIKRVKGFIAPVLVIYTILVTYFLAQTAWDDVSKRLRRHTDVKFLDVLVQEERRHLRSFQDVVQNYRGVVQIQIRDKVDSQKEQEYVEESPSLNQTNNSVLEVPKSDLNIPADTKHQEPDLYAYDNDDEDINNELKLLLEKQKAKANRGPKPVYKVEVEEWDENTVHSKPVIKEASHSKQGVVSINNNYLNSNSIPGSSGLARTGSGNVQAQAKNGNSYADSGYTTEYCEDVFDGSGQQPSICKRELAERGTDRHIAISSYSLLFKELGGIYVYSAFLDTRDISYTVRLMTVGGKGLDKTKSVYWCVFYTPVQRTTSRNWANSSLQTTAGYVQKQQKQATQLTYYAASDGHQKDNQFYIMSCPVPEAAKTSLLPPHHGLFQVIVGSVERPFLDTVQDSITVRAIINIPLNLRPLRDASSPHRTRSYFAKMEDDLLSLNISSIKANTENKDGFNGNNVSNNVGNSNNISNTKDEKNRYSSIGGDDEDLTSIISVVQNNNLDNTAHLEDSDDGTLSNRDDTVVTCVAPLQGNIGVIQIVEFIELSLLLGSQHIVFYTFRVFDEVRNALKMYEARGLVTIMPWNLPAPNTVWAKGRDIALNDCLYRTINLFDYALFLDIDEFFVPRATPDLPSFMKYLRAVHKFNSSRVTDLVFSSAYFPPPSKIQFKNLTTAPDFTRDVNKFATLRSIHRTYINSQHALRMIKVAKAFRVGAGERKRTSFTISSRYAAVNHYSYCPQDSKSNSSSVQSQATGSQNSPDNAAVGDSKKPDKPNSNTDLCSHTKADWIMWRYKSKLIERTKESVKKLNRG